VNNLHQEKAPSKRLKLSIVSTLYCSAPYIEEFCRRASGAASCLVGDDYEIILVNDGSPDNSLEIAVNLHNQDAGHIIVVDLSRNFGHHKAIMTGLGYASGDKVFLIDVDLEEEPEWLVSFSEHMEREHCDVVYGQQQKRRGGFFERWSGELFYLFFNAFSKLNVAPNQVTARLMTRRYVDALLLHREREITILGLWHITGFHQTPHSVTKHATSQTTYTFRRKMAILVDSIASFSAAPLRGIFFLGMIISCLAGIYSSYLVFNWIFFAKPLAGWTSLMASIWLLGGMILFSVGIVGIYLSKVFNETKQRPYTIVRQLYGRDD